MLIYEVTMHHLSIIVIHLRHCSHIVLLTVNKSLVFPGAFSKLDHVTHNNNAEMI